MLGAWGFDSALKFMDRRGLRRIKSGFRGEPPRRRYFSVLLGTVGFQVAGLESGACFYRRGDVAQPPHPQYPALLAGF